MESRDIFFCVCIDHLYGNAVFQFLGWMLAEDGTVQRALAASRPAAVTILGAEEVRSLCVGAVVVHSVSVVSKVWILAVC